MTALWTLGLALAAWLLRSTIHASAQGSGAGFAAQMADATLSAVLVAGLEGLVIGLLPLRFLDGERIKRWNLRVWLALFGLSLFAFVEVLLNPASGYISHGDGPTVLSALIVFLGFGVVSVSFWGFFRLRSRQPT